MSKKYLKINKTLYKLINLYLNQLSRARLLKK